MFNRSTEIRLILVNIQCLCAVIVACHSVAIHESNMLTHVNQEVLATAVGLNRFVGLPFIYNWWVHKWLEDH